MTLHVLVLGSAAGGGFPQWNGNDETSRRARVGDPKLPLRTQSSLALSADGRRWVLLNASPDLREQINARSQLHPQAEDAKRSSPIAAVVLTNADVDHVAGLLSLRENQPFALYAHRRVLDVLAENSIFNVLNPACVTRRGLPLDDPQGLCDAIGAPLDLRVVAFTVPGKAPLWREDEAAPSWGTRIGDTIGLEIRSGDSANTLFYIPGCAAMTSELARRLDGTALVFFDGTLWRDDEMVRAGLGPKTGQRMGHMSVSGPEGTVAAFRDIAVARKILVHINNSNPILLDDSAERRTLDKEGWEVAYDGMEVGP
jgi:pyrroloquinoline quinone biosynthesis protein B